MAIPHGLRVTVAVAGALLLACGRPPAERTARPVGTPEVGPRVADSLVCADGQYPSFGHSDIGEDQPGGPQTPEGALDAWFERNGSSLQASDSIRAGMSEEAAQLVYEQEGNRVFSAYVEKIGDSWYVTYIYTCQDFARASYRGGVDEG